MQTRNVRILKMDNYPSIGTIATIKFLDELPPAVGDIFESNRVAYRIVGINVSVSSKLLRDNSSENIFDCIVEILESSTEKND